MGSQCSEARMGVIWHDFFDLVSNLAAALWTNFSLSMDLLLSQVKSELQLSSLEDIL